MIRKYLNAALLGATLALLTNLGCQLLAAKNPRVDLFECRVRALEPVVGDVLDAHQLVRDLYAGKASLGATLSALKLTEAEGAKLAADFQACEPAPVEVPEGQGL